jgi:hypothetical protein
VWVSLALLTLLIGMFAWKQIAGVCRQFGTALAWNIRAAMMRNNLRRDRPAFQRAGKERRMVLFSQGLDTQLGTLLLTYWAL